MQHQTRVWSPALASVLLAQFLSAFADNAILVAALVLVKRLVPDPAMAAALQMCFVAPYIVFAPLVGPYADSRPKGQVMVVANVVKWISAALMLLCAFTPGAQAWWVLLIYAMTGLGAAMYSPAKYGILTQLCGPEALVKANGLMEGSTIVAILLGFVGGGLLADYSLTVLLATVTLCYALAVGLSWRIPLLPVAHALDHFDLKFLLQDYWTALQTLFRDPWARVSLLGTSVFWGSGATLRLILFAWVPVALALPDPSAATNLAGVVSIGIIIGAALAAMTVTLQTVWRSLVGGLLLGVPLMLLAAVHQLPLAVILLILMGVAGGFFVVPLNAILQEKGHESVGAGHAIAVQNFCENIAMFVLAGVYGKISGWWGPTQTVFVFGALLFVLMLPLVVITLRQTRRLV